ncbi:MAG: hypothetical protein AAGM67_04520 [Bacteroidota bacterium]
MQKYSVVLFLTGLLAFTTFSCEKVEEFTQFDLNYTASVTIPATAGINLPFDLFTPDIETDSESKFAVEDTRKELLQEVKLTKMDLTITSPDDQRFDFLKEITVYIDAEGLGELIIAEKKEIPDNIGAELSLDVSENDIQEYIKKDGFKLRVNTVTDEALSEAINIDIATTFFVDAKVFGQ